MVEKFGKYLFLGVQVPPPEKTLLVHFSTFLLYHIFSRMQQNNSVFSDKITWFW